MVMVGVVNGLASPPIGGIEGGVAKVADTLVGVDIIALLPLAMARTMDRRCLETNSKLE